jgi:pilus assembly protein Flp/PilA
VSSSLGTVVILNLKCVVPLARLLADESGQDMIEYALIAATIGLGTVAGINGIATSISGYLSLVGAGFDNAVHHT